MSRRIARVNWSIYAAAFFIAALVVCFSGHASATDFTDIQGHWAQGTIERWADSGILSGYDDGGFHPDDPVTRAQLATILYHISGGEPVEGHFNYPDLSQSDWFYDALNTLNMYGIALNTDDKMLPDQLLTREEAFYMIAKTFFIGSDQDVRWEVKGVTDADEISDRYTHRISSLLLDHYISGADDGALYPKRTITRAEVMKVIDNIVGLYVTQPGTYDVYYGQNVLVACGGVTLNRVDPPQGFRARHGTAAYLFGSAAAEGGVTFPNAFWAIYTASQNKPFWTVGEGHRIDLMGQRTHSAYQFPDTRFSGGFGRALFPYVISTPEQFRWMAESTGDVYPAFQLIRDLDLGNLSAPLEITDTYRTRTELYGGGHTVTYQMAGVQGDEICGLFKDWKGKCFDLTLDGIVDVSFEDGSIKGENGKLTFGGFAGYYDGIIENCTSNMDITVHYSGDKPARLSVGGLIGVTYNGVLNLCTASGSVEGSRADGDGSLDVGGIVGSAAVSSNLNAGAVISECGTNGAVTAVGGNHSCAGGIAGILSSAIGTVRNKWYLNLNSLDACWSTADVSASDASFQSDCGGLVGHLEDGVVRNSWASPTVTVSGGSFQNVGAVTGACYAAGSIADCWANAKGCAAGGNLHTGGITGRLVGTISNCYTLGTSALGDGNALAFRDWNEGVVEASTDMTGLTQSGRDLFYRSCGWDFTEIWDKTGAYPILRTGDQEAQRAAQG